MKEYVGIGIARYHAYDNTTNYQDFWESAGSPPSELRLLHRKGMWMWDVEGVWLLHRKSKR